jgi:hypothetical protein
VVNVPVVCTGHTTGAELDEVARYLSDLVKHHNLPEKVMVYHQVAGSVVRKESGLKKHGGRLMTPNEVLGLKPRPEYVMFE